MTALPATLLKREVAAPRRRALPGARAPTSMMVAGVASALLASGAVADMQHIALRAAVVGMPVAAGISARRSPRTRRFGTILIAMGLTWALALLSESPFSIPYSVGRVVAWLTALLLVYAMLTFPEGRLAGRTDRVLFGALVALMALLYVGSALFVSGYPIHSPWASCRTSCPPNAFLILSHEPGAMQSVVAPVREMLAVLLIGGVTLSLAHKMRAATGVRRRLLAPVTGMGVVAVIVLAAFIITRQVAPNAAAVDTLAILWSLCYAGIATAFLVGLVQRRLLIADALARLSDTLNSTLDATQLRAALASALGDDTLELLFWDDRRRGWFSTDGRCTAPPSRPGRAIAKIDDDGSRFAVLLLDPALEADDELLHAVGAHARAALRRARTSTELATTVAELERSRSRIAAAATSERRRIERDLHDGAQQRLVALRIKASLAEELLRDDPVAASAKVHELGHDLELALDEVRALARGVYPSLLADRGIEDALRNAVRGSPLVATISAHGVARYPAEVETAVYFTCLEALQNTIKHARGATRLTIALRGNGTLDFEVHDDGCGFMPTPLHDSGGLSNMRDRVEAVGGQLTVDSTPGAGTRILGTIPVAAPAAPAPPTP